MHVCMYVYLYIYIINLYHSMSARLEKKQLANSEGLNGLLS